MSITKIKNHVRDHKVAYISAGVGIVVGASIATIVLKKPDIQVAPKIQQILSYKPTATLEVHIEALGDPGNVIQDLTTGTIYASQGQAARELGLRASDISKHLAGKSDAVKGHRFVKLGKASVAQSQDLHTL